LRKGGGKFVKGLRYSAVGFEFAAIIVTAVVVGYHADIYFGTAPFLMVILIAGGFTGAVRRLLLSLKRTMGSS